MPAKVTLRVAEGILKGQEFVFDDPNTSIIGRSADCQLQVPDDEEHLQISRHHCLLDVNPPDIRIRDFGSLNGTWVNGKKIGQREDGQTPEEGAKATFPEHDLKHGDVIQLGKTTFRVEIFVPIVCTECSTEIAEDQKQVAEVLPGVFQCERCRKKAEVARQKEAPRPKAKKCAKCGRDVSGEVGEHRHGDFMCVSCKADPLAILKMMLQLAGQGSRNLVAIRGYQIIKELGHGGMGAVYLARHDKTGRQVALKIMLPKVAVEEWNREMFEREVENTKALKHRNVVQLYDHGCSNGTFFFTLEFCDGGSVDQLMANRGGRLPLREAGPIILQALDGLVYAHGMEVAVKMKDGRVEQRCGIVHRDLKPQNLFLVGNVNSRVAKIGDFGLAKAFDSAGLSGHTRTGSVAGTPVFMPRQQVINFKYAKPEVDVWATAATMYHILTGAFPRDFPLGKDPWRAVLTMDPVPIRQRDPSIPAKVAEVLDQALMDRKGLHFKTAADFQGALMEAL